MSIVVWTVIILVLAGAAYFVFFKSPQFVETITPGGFKSTAELSKIKINSDAILGSSAFQALSNHGIPQISIKGQGRPNPFMGF